MDIVYIRKLGIDTVIGVYDWERTIRQTVKLDLEMGTEIGRAAAVDALEHTLDYNQVAARLVDFVRGSEFQLIETLAEQCAALVLKEFGVRWLRLRVSKPGAVPDAEDVGVIIERGQRGSPVTEVFPVAP